MAELTFIIEAAVAADIKVKDFVSGRVLCNLYAQDDPNRKMVAELYSKIYEEKVRG